MHRYPRSHASLTVDRKILPVHARIKAPLRNPIRRRNLRDLICRLASHIVASAINP